MADSSLTLSKRLDDYTAKFAGISQVRWCSTRQAIPGSATITFLEVPTLRDQVTFTPATPTFENRYVYGKDTPWTSAKGEPGDTEMSIVISAVDEALLELGFDVKDVTNGISETADTHPSGKAGSWDFKGVDMNTKVVEGILWVISEDGKFSFMIKNFRGYASLYFNGNDPVGITLTGNFTTPVEGDTDGDILFGTYAENVVGG